MKLTVIYRSLVIALSLFSCSDGSFGSNATILAYRSDLSFWFFTSDSLNVLRVEVINLRK